METLGAVEVVCSDKTGTLTQNKMTVTECYLDGRLMERERLEPFFQEALAGDETHSCAGRFLLCCVLCNDGQPEENGVGDPTELALLHMAKSSSVTVERIRERYPRLNEIGFDSGRKMMTTLHREEGGMAAYTKGAAERILENCDRHWQGGRITELTGELM